MLSKALPCEFLYLLSFRKTRQKNSRRLELSISKNTSHGRWGQGHGSVDPRFPPRFAFPGARNPRISSTSRLEKIFPAIFRGLSWSSPREPAKDPGNSHSLLEFSDSCFGKCLGSASIGGQFGLDKAEHLQWAHGI